MTAVALGYCRGFHTSNEAFLHEGVGGMFLDSRRILTQTYISPDLF